MANVEHSVLLKTAIGKLTGAKPKAWDTDARDLFNATARTMQPDVSDATLEATWRDAMAHMRDNARDEWDQYARLTKRSDMVGVGWDKVRLVKGQADGDSFELIFDVDGEPCVIECTDVQLLDPSFIQRKLVMYTRKDVSCPYLGKKQLEAWRRNVVLPWLKSDAFKHVERETMTSTVESLVREFCSDTVAAETGPEVWLQMKRPVLEAENVYAPFPGLQDFIARRAGNDATKKMIKNTLARLGFVVTKKGKMRLRFHSILVKELYEDDSLTEATYDDETSHTREAGGGEVNEDRAGSQPRADERRNSILDQLRSEERDGLEAEGGHGPATPEAPGGASDLPDDPFTVIP